MPELGKKRDPGVKSWDPKKKKPSMKIQIECPYCWYAHHSKGVITKHINQQHWDET